MSEQVDGARLIDPVVVPAPNGSSKGVSYGPDNGVAVGPALPRPAPQLRAAAPPPPSGAGAGPDEATSWLVPLVVLVVGVFMSVLDTSIVNVALPTVELELGVSASDGQWVSTAYSLAEGVMVPICGWLGHRFGSKQVYLVCLGGFTIASALCGLAGGLVPLVGFRILQAIPGGVIPVTCMTMLRRMVPPERLGAAVGLYGLGVIVAPAVGPTLGGVLVEYVDWRSIFFVNVPIGVVGVVAAAVVLKATPGVRDRPLDILGFVTIAGALFALLLALEEGHDWGWTSYRIVILFIAAAVLLALFVVIELEVQRPLLDLRIFARAQFVLSLVLVSAISLGTFASAFFIPQFLQSSVRGLTPLNTGIALIPMAAVLAVLLPVTGVLYDRFGARWLAMVGLLSAGGGLLVLSRISVDIPLGSLQVGMVVLGAGVGLGFIPVLSGGLAAAPREAAESASSLSTLTQRVSQSLGLGILNAFITGAAAQALAGRSGLLGEYASTDPRVVSAQEQGAAGLLGLYQQFTGLAQTDAYSQAFFVVGLICLAGAVVAVFLPSGRPEPGPSAGAH